jgi:Amidohydrolase
MGRSRSAPWPSMHSPWPVYQPATRMPSTVSATQLEIGSSVNLTCGSHADAPGDQYPGALIIHAHAGGFVPYASHRFAGLARVFRLDAAKPAALLVLASFQRFYFETALSSSAAALPSLKSFGVNGRILFGTDFPFAPADIAASFTAKLNAYDGLTTDEHAAINHGNAWTLFPRLSVADASKEAVKLAT